jgi:hypothetical protein
MKGEATLQWIEATLVNDETSTDADLVKYFHDEGGLEHESISFILRQRDSALRNPLKFKLNPEGIIL